MINNPMKYTNAPLKYFFLLSLSLLSLSSHAIDSNSIEKQANISISELYHRLESLPTTSMTERIDWISAQFKGEKYILGALGEGPNARYDQFPKYRVDGFDCDTYVTTVLSLALANSLNSFKQCLKFVRYKNGKVTYIDRNHFTSIDWNHENQQRGVLKDITLNFKDKDQKPVAVYAKALINKSGWYEHKTITTIRLEKDNKTEQLKRLAELKKKGETLGATPSSIAYIPLTALFNKNSVPNEYLFAQIPQSSIIEIIRPNWDLRELIGTCLNVSHLGFAIWKNKQLYFRQASSQLGKVVDVPLIDYLRDALKSPTIKGINIQIVVPSKPITC